MVDVLCGELPTPGSRVHADVSIRAGGSAVNAATAAQAAGASATVLGRVGVDPSGDFVASALAARGVEARLARDQELATGAAVALGSSVVAHRGANARLSPEDIPDVIAADALFVSGFALFQTGSTLAARAALERFSGPWAAVDLASPKLAADARLDGANVVLATADEARALTGAEPDEAARRLAAQFAVVCIKLGAAGAIAAHGDRIERAAAEPVERSSAFGAGDAFGAVLLVALARGEPLASALELACQAGAHAAAL
jgi:sugar/nucleoside kinase (ribokinase family)